MHDDRQDWKARALLAAALAICLAPSAWAQPATATLEIHVRNVSPRGGIMRLGLYDAAGYPDDKTPVASADVPATRGETVIVLKNLTPGTYAIEAYQDTNSNDRMDKSWIGLPMEPYGFSRDARPVLSKPTFDRVKFILAPGANVQVLHLQNSDAPGE
jgi:uncharacterized protein (DUF2141 family)